MVKLLERIANKYKDFRMRRYLRKEIRDCTKMSFASGHFVCVFLFASGDTTEDGKKMFKKKGVQYRMSPAASFYVLVEGAEIYRKMLEQVTEESRYSLNDWRGKTTYIGVPMEYFGKEMI